MKKEKNESRINMQTLQRIFAAHKPFAWKIAWAFTLLIITSLMWSLAPLAVAKATDLLASKEATFKEVLMPLSLVLFCYITGIVIGRVRNLYEAKYLQYDVIDSIARTTLYHLCGLSIGQHRDSNSVVTSNKISSGQHALRNFFSTIIYQIIPVIFSTLTAILVMTITYPLIGLTTLFFAVIVVVFGFFASRRFAEPIQKIVDIYNDSVSPAHGELLKYFDSIKIVNEQIRLTERSLHLRHRRKQASVNVFRRFIHVLGLIAILVCLGRWVAILLAAYFIYEGHYEIGAMTAVLVWAAQSLGNLTKTEQFCRVLTEDWANIVAYFKIMDTEPDVVTPEGAVKLPCIEGSIELRNVFFTYPECDEQVLKGVNLKIEAGQKVGIVGATGSGKSTLVGLLQAAYNPDVGSVLIDGYDLSSIDHATYRGNIGIMEQTPIYLDQSLRRNVLLGVPEVKRRGISDDVIVKVLESVGLEDFTDSLNKSVGEMGKKKSGGQRQRIAIARLLLQEPDLIIMDEGTCSLDAVTEADVQQALDLVSPDATRIYITHRLATVKDADVIFVMHDGQVVSQGTHEELIGGCDVYNRFFNYRGFNPCNAVISVAAFFLLRF